MLGLLASGRINHQLCDPYAMGTATLSRLRSSQNKATCPTVTWGWQLANGQDKVDLGAGFRCSCTLRLCTAPSRRLWASWR
jgi:hypothetical protein